MKSIRPKPQKLDPSTRFKDGPDSINRRTISDFWQWAYSDLMQNVERAVLAEYIVAALIGVDNKLRVPWLAYDLKLPNGKTVEVKTMSKLQAWYQRKLSSPRVVIKPTRKLNLAQWEFYAFNRKQVEKMLEGRKSISLKFLRNSGYRSVTAYELQHKVAELCKDI